MAVLPSAEAAARPEEPLWPLLAGGRDPFPPRGLAAPGQCCGGRAVTPGRRAPPVGRRGP